MVDFINDPVPLVIKAFEELFPGFSANIQFVGDLDGAGSTTFPYNGQTPLINVSIDIPIKALPEILAHELAHIAKPDDEHGEEWETAFDSIFNRATELYSQDYANFNNEVK